MNKIVLSVIFCLLLASAWAAPQFFGFGPSGTGAGIGGGSANPFGASAFGAGVASGQNGGIGVASGQGSAFGGLFGQSAQGTGNGFGFGK